MIKTMIEPRRSAPERGNYLIESRANKRSERPHAGLGAVSLVLVGAARGHAPTKTPETPRAREWAALTRVLALVWPDSWLVLGNGRGGPLLGRRASETTK